MQRDKTTGYYKSGERYVNPRKMLSMAPDVQGLLRQIGEATGQSDSAVVASLIIQTAEILGLKAENNQPKYKL